MENLRGWVPWLHWDKAIWFVHIVLTASPYFTTQLIFHGPIRYILVSITTPAKFLDRTGTRCHFPGHRVAKFWLGPDHLYTLRAEACTQATLTPVGLPTGLKLSHGPQSPTNSIPTWLKSSWSLSELVLLRVEDPYRPDCPQYTSLSWLTDCPSAPYRSGTFELLDTISLKVST